MDEIPSIVFHSLYNEERTMKFIPILASKRSSQEESTTEQITLSDPNEYPQDNPGFTHQDFQPYKVEDLAERHTDNFLQCNCTPEELDTSLRRIDEISQTNIEEQGVNTLFLALGMLYFTESSASEKPVRSPIFLLPVEIDRKSARTGFTVSASDEDPMLNPTLVEYMKQSFDVSLPDLPDFSEDSSFDIQDYFIKISKLIETKKGWALKTDIYLAHFTFQKFVMFKDIEKNSEYFKNHRLLQQLVNKSESISLLGLPSEIQQLDLDKDFPPEEIFSVLDADSSQLRAIAAIARGHDMVIEGPPGTGKSQTIVNIIAQALSKDQSILFVSEKMAALQVVYRRLKESNLSEFCLELHSTKGKRKEVIDELKRTFDLTLQAPPNSVKYGEKLKGVRKNLNEYVKEVHKTIEPLGLSPFEVYGLYFEVYNSVFLPFQGDVSTITKAQIDEIELILNQIVTLASPLGKFQEHPWCNAQKSFYSQSELYNISQFTGTAREYFNDFIKDIDLLTSLSGSDRLENFIEFESLFTLFSLMTSSPGLKKDCFRENKWQSVPQNIAHIIEEGKKFDNLKRELFIKYQPRVLEIDHSESIRYIKDIHDSYKRYFSVLIKKYRQIKKEWNELLISGSGVSMTEIIPDLEVAIRCRKLRTFLESVPDLEVAVFSGNWKKSDSDWDFLARTVSWISEFNTLLTKVNVNDRIYVEASSPSLMKDKLEQLNKRYRNLRETLDQLICEVGWPQDYFDEFSIEEIGKKLLIFTDSIDKASEWAAFTGAKQKGDGTIANYVVDQAYKELVPVDQLTKVFKRSVFQAWLDWVISGNEILKEFHSLSHNDKIKLFQELDEKVKLESRVSLISQLRSSAQAKLTTPEAQFGIQHLRREFARQRKFTPLRKTVQQAEFAIRAIKPCFLMSPLSVSQYLRGDLSSFDLVVFDEASQLPTEDSIGAICRSRQLVVVGDTKQLPPTNFFAIQNSMIDAEIDDQGVNIVDDTESVLEEFLSTGCASARLKWHYRSKIENLISFSNHIFYDSDLYTFPSSLLNQENEGLHFRYVPDGIYEGKGLNRNEAKMVVNAIVEHIKTTPGESLGIGTFNLRQQLAIQDEIEVRRRNDPSVEGYFDRNKAEPFFVKNLENIQGDERDVIFISVTYGKDLSGKLRYNFGPINSENGWRRLNVLITRARKKMVVFSSIKGDDINPTVTNSRGPQLIRDFLLYAERGMLSSLTLNKMLTTESPFEKDVMMELMNAGYLVDPQVGTSGYRIDLGVRHQAKPGMYLCGVECDGVSYHSSETARDRDRLRQQILESRGWKIIRIWSTDWFKDRKNQIRRLIDFIEKARIDGDRKERPSLSDQKDIACSDSERSGFEDPGSEIRKDKEENGGYTRPVAMRYKFVNIPQPIFPIMDSTNTLLISNLSAIVLTEGPIHYDHAFNRLASIFDQRRGVKIESRFRGILRIALDQNQFEQEGKFLISSGTKIYIRDWKEFKLTADYIYPEELSTCLRLIIDSAKMMPRDRLIGEVIAVMGLVRNSKTKDVIDQLIQNLLESKVFGEGSEGLAMFPRI